jgi:hypothetical protein
VGLLEEKWRVEAMHVDELDHGPEPTLDHVDIGHRHHLYSLFDSTTSTLATRARMRI